MRLHWGNASKVPSFWSESTLADLIADLPGAAFCGADLSHTLFCVDIKNQGMGQMRTDPSNANLERATLAGADFNRSLMTFCNPRGSNLRGVNFFRARLARADLTEADVEGADFTEADLSGTIFRGVKGFADAKGLARAENFRQDRSLTAISFEGRLCRV